MEKLLLVEDDPNLIRMLTEFLASEHFSVTARTGQTAACSTLEAERPDLALVDISLAEGNGFAVCAKARELGIPVIFLTASGDTGDTEATSWQGKLSGYTASAAGAQAAFKQWAGKLPALEALLNGEIVADFGSIDAPEEETGRILTTPEHYAYLKIAEGCDNRCSYCIIPYLRGKFRSRQLDDVLYEARLLAASGVKELIVVAQDTSRYGTDLPGHKRLLPELLRQLCEIEQLHWVRIHYIYPDEIDDELIDVIASEPKIVKYLDIPIQHCNSKILKLMNRRGDGVFLRRLFDKLRSRIPGLVLRTSVITGLPGEGEEEFAELCEFLKEQKLERVGAFAFSPEEGTPAAEMEFPDNEIALSRAEMIETIQSGIMDEYSARMLGTVVEVVVDGFDEEFGQYFGRTYADSPDIDGRVWIATEEPISEGEFVLVQIDSIIDGDLSGFLVEESL